MRTFAKKINVSPSTLSEILRNKRRLSKTTASTILSIVAPNDTEALNNLQFLEEHYAPYKNSEVSVHHIATDEAALFEKWYHLAIVTFFDSTRYDNTPESIANYFGITVKEAQEATHRLLRLGVIKEENGRYVNSAQFYITNRSMIADSIHLSKEAAIENAKRGLNNKEIQDTSSFSMMFSCFDSKLVPDAIDYLDKMKAGFVKKFKGKGDKSAVYQLSIQLFPCEKIHSSET